MSRRKKIIISTIMLIIISIAGYKTWRHYSVPEIGRNLPSSFEIAELEFKKRIENTFPVGTAESEIVERLGEQGFQIKKSYASYEQSGFPCTKVWRVLWKTDETGNIISTNAVYGGICL